MSGNWPQEWDDPDDGFPGETDETAADEAELAEVSAWLTAAPDPVLPAGVEARISAALAAESARSAAPDYFPPLRSPESGPRVLGPAPARGRVRRHLRLGRGLMTGAGSLLVCLVIAGLGFALSRGAPAESSSSAPAAASAPSRAESNGTMAGPANGSAAGGTSKQQYSTSDIPVAVTASGTRYAQATLTGQVRAQVAIREPAASATAPVPQGSEAGTSAGTASSASPTSPLVSEALRGCVLQLTKGTAPVLVDRATYDGTPAYVIATAKQVWVVRLGCTANRPEQITSVPLAS